ncbi:MAG: lysophospholipid acyltransferase family protein [Elusimicrobiota bacterium]
MDVLRAAAPYLAYGFATIVGGTSRIRWEGAEHLRAVKKGGKGFIYAFWHQRQILFTYTHRSQGAHVMVSRSRDGEIIARTMRLSGIGAVRGSSSRGASAATREMLDLLARGRPIGITPDGPRGPARTVKTGVLYLALKSGCPILPITNAVSRRIVFRKAWDDCHLPLPLSTACVAHGAPMRVRAGDDIQRKAAELKETLDRITAEADRLVS